jgi:hypothetical protein
LRARLLRAQGGRDLAAGRGYADKQRIGLRGLGQRAHHGNLTPHAQHRPAATSSSKSAAVTEGMPLVAISILMAFFVAASLSHLNSFICSNIM